MVASTLVLRRGFGRLLLLGFASLGFAPSPPLRRRRLGRLLPLPNELGRQRVEEPAPSHHRSKTSVQVVRRVAEGVVVVVERR